MIRLWLDDPPRVAWTVTGSDWQHTLMPFFGTPESTLFVLCLPAACRAVRVAL